MNPLVHYLKFGLPEGRQSRTLARNRDCELILGSGFFIKDWYLSSYPEIAVQAVDPLEHFLDFATVERAFDIRPAKAVGALMDLQRQNNSIRLENAELGRACERMSAELAKRKAETIQLARERDKVRSMIARRLTSKRWLLKGLFHL
jgi:hypothetical protein